MHRFEKLIAAVSVFALSCATLQTGILPGKWMRRDHPVVPITMGWESHSASHEMGDMMVTFPSGERYHGAFVRITDGVKVDHRMAVYNAWTMEGVWSTGVGYGYYGVPGGWGSWGGGIYPDFISFERNYTGKIVAGLSSSEGHAIRCKFRVNDPQVGFISGGSGACQVSLGGHILVHF